MPEPNLLPFLDLVLAFVGILIVVFALQARNRPETGRPPAIDDLIVCQADGVVTLYAGPEAEPIVYRETELDALLARLAAQGDGVRNLVFALTRDCFGTRRAFEDAFSRFTSRLDPRAETRRAFRLSFRPLSTVPETLPRLLTEWRGHGD
ncbi:hypothetical protein [Allochromatium tepidum]|nr:hypothetical protein [Allochromatium tepidum]